MTEKKVILIDAPDIVTYRTDVSGWIASDGTFWGKSERDARYRSCTHVRCSTCGAPVERGWTACGKCRDKVRREKFLAMPVVPYESDMVVCLRDSDEYFFSQEDIEYYADSNELDASTLELVVCEPQHAHEVDPDEYYSDLLPQDQYVDDIDPELSAAFEKLNELIRTKKPILSWIAGETRTRFEPEVARPVPGTDFTGLLERDT